MKYRTFETDRLLIRPVQFGDADFIFELMTSEKWIKFIGDRKIKTVEDARKYIEVKMMPQLEKLGFGNYAVIRKSDDERLGTVGLYDREGLEGVDIGFAFLNRFEKMGFAFEASTRLMKAAKEDFGLTHIKGITVEENVPSQNLLRKLGLRFVEMTRIEGDPEELMLFEKRD